LKKVIAVEMAACIVPTIMKMYPSRKKANCRKIGNYLQNNNFKMVKKKSTNKLSSVKPSGKRDESFFELVYEVARQIPKGRVTSYGAIANCLGTKLSARMVGWAMNGAGRVRPKVPAHRVVNRIGMLTGKHHFHPPKKMETLLKKEGIKIKNDKVVDFEKHFWDPVKEIGF
jgi:methylated-DNA-protein-cysteine methyltransferase-like protein